MASALAEAPRMKAIRAASARRFLFICSQNRLRSPTAEQIFADRVETESAGLKNDAENPVTPELLKWAEVIFVNGARAPQQTFAEVQASLRWKTSGLPGYSR